MHQNCRIFAKLALTSTKINQKHKGGSKGKRVYSNFCNNKKMKGKVKEKSILKLLQRSVDLLKIFPSKKLILNLTLI